MNPSYRQSDSPEEDRSEPSVHSVSISRRTASRSARFGRGRKRTVTRGRRQFESAVAQFEVTSRLRWVGQASLRVRGTSWRPAKIAGILVALAALAMLATTHTSDTWFVYAEDVQIRSLTYLDGADIFRQSDVDGWNIMWLTPESIRDRLLTNPYVEDADVEIHLPARVTIDVAELHPIALWVTNEATYWLTPDGTALPAVASTAEGLPQIIDALGEAQAISSRSNLAVNPDVLTSALSLMQKLPGLNNKIRFNRDVGLNFSLPEQNVWVYWGDGENTETKLENLKAAEEVLADREDPATLVDVRFIHRPYLR